MAAGYGERDRAVTRRAHRKLALGTLVGHLVELRGLLVPDVFKRDVQDLGGPLEVGVSESFEDPFGFPDGCCQDVRLGHASINITLDTYSHVLPGLQAAAAEALDTILAEPVAEAR